MVDAGLATHLGVSNFSAAQARPADILSQDAVPGAAFASPEVCVAPDIGCHADMNPAVWSLSRHRNRRRQPCSARRPFAYPSHVLQVEELLEYARIRPVANQVELHPLLAQRKLVGVCLRKVGLSGMPPGLLMCRTDD